MKLKASLALAFGLLSGMAYSATDLVIATVNNRQMVEMQKLSKFFECLGLCDACRTARTVER